MSEVADRYCTRKKTAHKPSLLWPPSLHTVQSTTPAWRSYLIPLVTAASMLPQLDGLTSHTFPFKKELEGKGGRSELPDKKRADWQGENAMNLGSLRENKAFS